MEDVQLISKWLIARYGAKTAASEVRVTQVRLEEFAEGRVSISKSSHKRLVAIFRQEVYEDALEALRKPSPLSLTKNYDDDETLAEVKAGTSRSGINAKRSSGPWSNNGGSFAICEGW